MKCRNENRKEVILNHIANNIPSGKKLVLIDVYDADTGEMLEEQVPIFKKDIVNKGVFMKNLEPYVRMSSNKILKDKYYDHFTRTEKGYLMELFLSVDGFGRIKYGDNYQQYCRKVEDLSKVLNVSYETIRKPLISKMKKFDIIRTVTIKKGQDYMDEEFISFNPLLLMNGVYWDRWTVFTWQDVIKEYSLLTDKQIKRVLKEVDI